MKTIMAALGGLVLGGVIGHYGWKGERWEHHVSHMQGVPVVVKIDKNTGKVYQAMMSGPFREIEMPAQDDSDIVTSTDDDPYAGLGEVIELE